MSYATTRDSEQLRILDLAIAQFIQRYTSNPTTGNRRTLFLFPGGMGCQLLRARKPYKDNFIGTQTFQYDKIWLTPKTFTGDALKLKMHWDAQGIDRDLGDRIIIGDGAVELFGISPYSQFINWCDYQGLDWFVFGWDWRRRLEDSVSFFLTRFLPHFRNSVQSACGADPLDDFILIGHSFGGMVVNLILRQFNSLLANMTRAVTVSSPFYGYDGQTHRWFEGETYLNGLGKLNVIKVITSLPACYTLSYLDMATYLANQTALANDPNFPLTSYPSNDAQYPTQAVDPFNPGPQRYPTNTNFQMAELAHALLIYQQLVAPLAQYADRFYNIRGVQTSNQTIGGIGWDVVPGAVPNVSPISDQPPPAPGDDTQPAWTARLVTLPVNQCVTVQGAIDHMFMMEYAATQQAIASVL